MKSITTHWDPDAWQTRAHEQPASQFATEVSAVLHDGAEVHLFAPDFVDLSTDSLTGLVDHDVGCVTTISPTGEESWFAVAAGIAGESTAGYPCHLLVDGNDSSRTPLLASALDLVNADLTSRVTISPRRKITPKAAIFDLDGTLVNSLEAYFQVASMAAQSRGKTITREFVRGTLDANNHAFWELVFNEDEQNRDALIDGARRDARENWPDIQRRFVSSLDGIDATIRDLADRGIKLGIVTAGNGSTVWPLEQNNTHELFDAIITKRDVDAPKPDPQGLNLALDQLGVDAADAVYIGDSRIDIRTAHAAGCSAIGVLTGAGDAHRLASERPLHLLASVANLGRVIA